MRLNIRRDDETTDFSMSYTVVSGNEQLILDSTAPSRSRLDYDWFSTDRSVVSVSMYSTMTPLHDGEAQIFAFHKKTGKYL